MKSILPGQKERERIEAMSHVFTKADRVLSGNDVNVVVSANTNASAPSWTDGRTITFNKDIVGGVTSVEDLIRLSGLNYHELAHVLFTPRTGTKWAKAVMNEGLHDSANILEDQRIETLLTGMYPSTIPYLVSTFMRFCIMTEDAWKTNYVLVYGRRYIPADVRKAFKSQFKWQHLISDFETIIDEYRLLTYPRHYDRGLELIREFDALLKQLSGNAVIDPHGHSTGQRPDMTGGRPAPQAEQTGASDAASDLDEALEERDSESESGDGEGGGVGEESGQGGHGAGFGGHTDTPPLTSGEMQDLLEETAKEFEADETVQEDIASKQKAIVTGNGEVSTDLDERRFSEWEVWPEDTAVVRKFASVLEQLRADVDPGWKRDQASGRINIQRVMNDAPLDEIWDRWDSGQQDATDIECVIVIDTSGSMNYQIKAASRALWVIKRALETLKANVTVLSFGSESYVVYSKDSKANRTKFRLLTASGGTHAHPAVAQATRILEASKRANRIFIAITDGAWFGELSSAHNPSSDDMIKALGRRGVTTAIAHIGWGGDSHNCQVTAAVSDPLELIGFAKGIVAQSVKQKKVG